MEGGHREWAYEWASEASVPATLTCSRHNPGVIEGVEVRQTGPVGEHLSDPESRLSTEAKSQLISRKTAQDLTCVHGNVPYFAGFYAR